VTHEPGFEAIRVGAIAACVAAIALVAYVTFARRSAAIEPSDRWMLLIGFVVLAPLAYLLNAGLAVSGAKSVAFCNSCHVMEPYVADLNDPDSEHLAAQHYQFRWINDHQCYTCHSDYGLFGDVQAKLAGLRHVWFYTVGGYETPLKIRGTYDNARCLFCHGPVKSYQEIAEHEKNAAEIATSAKSCIGGACHVSPHPKSAAQPESAHAS
jgi:nitrate/TMAO reductase-like tetraheme cytochrome c subunit